MVRVGVRVLAGVTVAIGGATVLVAVGCGVGMDARVGVGVLRGATVRVGVLVLSGASVAVTVDCGAAPVAVGTGFASVLKHT